MLQQLGVSLDPMQQLSGLVNLINQTQAPQIQQQQYQQDFGLRQLQGDRGWETDQAQLGLRQQEQMQQQGNQDRSFGLQQDQFNQQQQYQDAMLGQKDATLQAAQADRANNNRMDFAGLLLKMFGNPMGAGMIDSNSASQYMTGLGFPGLINPQAQVAPLYNTSSINGDLPDEAFRQSYQKHTGR